MRFYLALAFSALTSPAAAWEFSPDPICTLRHTADTATIVVTYDAAVPEYAIHVTRVAGRWNDGVFFMAFAGPAPLTISTDRQIISPDGKTLSVRDAGFGNVLNGLEFNGTVAAGVGTDIVLADLGGIAAPMAAFRACPAQVPALS